MPLKLEQSEYFLADVELQFRWYLWKAGPRVASRYRAAVQATLLKVVASPHSGRPRFQGDPELEGLRCCPLAKPFQKQLLFYRVQGQRLIIERTIHGARNLPKRLREPPFESVSALEE
jgi:plasmid stabilization system protein ParE